MARFLETVDYMCQQLICLLCVLGFLSSQHFPIWLMMDLASFELFDWTCSVIKASSLKKQDITFTLLSYINISYVHQDCSANVKLQSLLLIMVY